MRLKEPRRRTRTSPSPAPPPTQPGAAQPQPSSSFCGRWVREWCGSLRVGQMSSLSAHCVFVGVATKDVRREGSRSVTLVHPIQIVAALGSLCEGERGECEGESEHECSLSLILPLLQRALSGSTGRACAEQEWLDGCGSGNGRESRGQRERERKRMRKSEALQGNYFLYLLFLFFFGCVLFSYVRIRRYTYS